MKYIKAETKQNENKIKPHPVIEQKPLKRSSFTEDRFRGFQIV